MSASELRLRNCQRRQPLDLRRFRLIARHVLETRLGPRPYEISVSIVAAPEMSRINERHLQHTGSTDVITFGYSAPGDAGPLRGDIFICIDDALAQARQFKTTWPAELIRYFVHAVLHLQGYDDHQPAARRAMKREENRLVRATAAQFDLGQIARRRRPPRTAAM